MSDPFERSPTDEARIESAGFREVCMCTQISFVRNLAGTPFPHRMSAPEARRLGSRLATKIIDLFEAKDVTDDDVISLIAEPVYGLTPTAERGPGYHLLSLTYDSLRLWVETMSANHLTISLTGTVVGFPYYSEATRLFVDRLAEVFPFAYSEKLGYLTSQPTLVGTGFRIRSWMHLAGLAHFGYLRELCNAAEVKGVLVELDEPDDPPPGCRIILFNRFSLGQSVEQIAVCFEEFVLRTCEQETTARWRLHYDEPFVLLDILRRAKAIASSALLISEEMALDLLSDLRLGLSTRDASIRGQRPLDPGWFANVMDPMFYRLYGFRLEEKAALPKSIRSLTPARDDALRALWLRDFCKFSISRDLIRRAGQ